MRHGHILRKIALCLIALLCCSGKSFANPCTAFISLSPQGTFPQFPNTQSSSNFNINTGGSNGLSCHWQATAPSWISLSPSSGGGGTQFQFNVTFTVAANPDLAPRTGTITVKQTEDGSQATETIPQAAATGSFTISLGTPTQTVVQGANASVNVTIARSGGFAGAVGLTATGQPSGVTITFNPNNTTFPSSTMTISATKTATTGTFSVVVTGVNGNVSNSVPLTLTVNPRPWQTTDVTVLTGAPTVPSGAPLTGQINTVAAPNVDELFSLTPTLDVAEPWWNGTWHWTDVTMAAAARGAASGTAFAGHINTLVNTDEVFFFDSAQDLSQLWWDGTNWHWTDVTMSAAAPPAAAGSALAGHINTLGNDDEVFYVGSNGHIYEPWWENVNFLWHLTDVTTAAVAPLAAAGTPLASHFNSVANVDEIFYLCTNQHICQLWWDGNTWHSADVTAISGAGVAGSGSPLIGHVNSLANIDEVFYLGADGHVDELWWEATHFQWHPADVTAILGAPLAAAGTKLAAHVNSFDHLDEVFYLGQDQHVYALTWDSTTSTWHFTDLTLAAGATLALPGSSLTSHFNSIANFDELFYIGIDQHIHEFFR